MPRSDQKKGLSIRFKPLKPKEKEPQRRGSLLLKGNGASLKSNMPSFDHRIKYKQRQGLPLKILCSKSRRTRIVGAISSKSRIHVSSGKVRLKSSNAIAVRLPLQATSLVNKNVSSRMVTETLMQEEQGSPRFMSLSISKGRLIRHKAIESLLARKTVRNEEESHQLSYAQRRQLFQALLKEPLPFLELHSRFGVSKQAMMRLVKNGFLKEMWGPKAVGIRFILSNIGKLYLKELEAAARYDPTIGKKPFIHLRR